MFDNNNKTTFIKRRLLSDYFYRYRITIKHCTKHSTTVNKRRLSNTRDSSHSHSAECCSANNSSGQQKCRWNYRTNCSRATTLFTDHTRGRCFPFTAPFFRCHSCKLFSCTTLQQSACIFSSTVHSYSVTVHHKHHKHNNTTH